MAMALPTFDSPVRNFEKRELCRSRCRVCAVSIMSHFPIISFSGPKTSEKSVLREDIIKDISLRR